MRSKTVGVDVEVGTGMLDEETCRLFCDGPPPEEEEDDEGVLGVI